VLTAKFLILDYCHTNNHFRYYAKFLRNNFKRTYSLSARAKTIRTKTTIAKTTRTKISRAKKYATRPA
jgi:hypothetical protein